MNYTLDLTNEQINIIIDLYQEYEIYTTNNYTLFRAKIKLCTLSIYTSGKLLLQGKDCDNVYMEICNVLNIKNDICGSNNDQVATNNALYKANIGCDEVGTGDFFGPIVVCASLVNEDNYLDVMRLGVKDSKQLSDEKILKIAPTLKTLVPHTITILKNENYNDIIQKYNLNKVKAVLHNFNISKFKAKYPEMYAVSYGDNHGECTGQMGYFVESEYLGHNTISGILNVNWDVFVNNEH